MPKKNDYTVQSKNSAGEGVVNVVLHPAEGNKIPQPAINIHIDAKQEAEYPIGKLVVGVFTPQ